MPAKKSTPNMEVWDQAFETPPKHTKKVPGAFSITAVDAQYCIMKMTELFGPVGVGWGYTTETEFRDLHVVCKTAVWIGDTAKAFGPYVSIQPLYKGQARILDTDAPKKGITDALTKCLSHVGIGGDVFMGMYDDNKYVSDLQQKQADKDRELGKAFNMSEPLTPEQEAEQKAMDDAARAAADL